MLKSARFGLAALAISLCAAVAQADDAVVKSAPEVVEGAAGRILAIAFSADGKRIATAGYDLPGDDSRGHAIRIWNAETKKQLQMIAADCDSVQAIAFSPDGSLVVVGDETGSVACLNTETGKQLFKTPGTDAETKGVAFSIDGKTIISGSDRFYGFDSRTGQKRGERKTHNEWAVGCLASSLDRKLLVAGCGTEGVILNASNMAPLHVLKGHERSVDAVAISKDKRRVATGCYDGTIKLWDTKTGKELITIKAHSTDGVSSLAFFNEDKSLASGGQDGQLMIWNVATGKAEQSIDASDLAVDAIAPSPDGTTLVTSDVVRLQFRSLADGSGKPAKPSKTSMPTMPAPDSESSAVDLSSLDQWEVVRGDWKQKDGAIVGEGNSRLNLKRTFPNEFVFRCKLRVNGPTNPRIRFGSFHFGYEGDGKQFFLHGPKATGEPFPFSFGNTYQIEVAMRKGEAVLRIDDREVARSNPKQIEERSFSLEAGGIRSKSSAEFSEIRVTVGP